MPWYRGLTRPDAETTFNAIVSYTDVGAPDPGLRYLHVKDEIGGVEWDIMDPNWDSVLDQLGVQAAGEKMEFYLSRRPVPGSITVHEITEDGVVIVHTEATFGTGGALAGMASFGLAGTEAN